MQFYTFLSSHNQISIQLPVRCGQFMNWTRLFMHVFLVMCSCFSEGTDFPKTFHAEATANNIQQDRLAHSTTVRNVMKPCGPFVLVSLTSIKCKHVVCYTCGCLCGPPSRPDAVYVCAVPVVIGMQHVTLGYRESCLMSPFVSERHSSTPPPCH